MTEPRRWVVGGARRALVLASLLSAGAMHAQTRMSARELGVAPGIFQPGPYNAITDVTGVLVGHATVISGDSVRSGVTAIRPHGGNVFHERVPAAVAVGNGFGKLLGVTQLRELGELETPILLTCTLCVWRVADAMVDWLLAQPRMENVRSINPVVGETNDGALNAIRSRLIPASAVHHALDSARSGPVAEGSVGAGTGTVAFGWKGGIGTSSRVLPASLGGWTVGVLVQSNFGGVLQVAGAPVGRELGRYSFQGAIESSRPRESNDAGDGSVMIIVATDAPVSDRNLSRLARRGIMGLSRTGSAASNGSGDYVIAFSTATGLRRFAAAAPPARGELINDEMSALFQAAIEATEESIYDSMFLASTTSVRGRTIEAIPLDRVKEILARYGIPRRAP